MNRQIEPSPDDASQDISPPPSWAADQPDEAWVEMVSEEGYRLLFGLDDEPGGDAVQGRR